MNLEAKMLALVTVALVSIVSCITIATIHQQDAVVEAVKAGANPLEAACAMKR